MCLWQEVELYCVVLASPVYHSVKDGFVFGWNNPYILRLLGMGDLVKNTSERVSVWGADTHRLGFRVKHLGLWQVALLLLKCQTKWAFAVSSSWAFCVKKQLLYIYPSYDPLKLHTKITCTRNHFKSWRCRPPAFNLSALFGLSFSFSFTPHISFLLKSYANGARIYKDLE